MLKHGRGLEAAGLATTEKVGRVRHCRLGTHRLDDAATWIAQDQTQLGARYDRLAAFLAHTRDIPPGDHP